MGQHHTPETPTSWSLLTVFVKLVQGCVVLHGNQRRRRIGEHYMVSMVQEGNGGSTYPAWPCTGIPLLISIFDISRLYFHITTVLGDKPTLLMLNGGRITYTWIYILHNAVPTLLYHSSSPLPTMINHGETTQVHTDTSDNYSALLNILSSFRRKLIQDLIRKQK